jgi:hypothetical protein
MDLDDLVQAAVEAGYFGTVSDWETRPGINELLELLDQSKRSPVYSELQEDPDMIALDESLKDLDQELTESGIDLNQSNKAIREQLEQWQRQFRDTAWEPDKARIERSTGGGHALRHPTYESYLEELDVFAKQGGVSREQLIEEWKLARNDQEFLEERTREVNEYVEEPVRPLMQQVYDMGGTPYGSNAFGPGRKGVQYVDKTGNHQFLSLSSMETETTPQGEQTLVEGVKPVTTQDLLEVEAKRPLRGGEAEAGPLFDVEGRSQMDLVEEVRKAEPEKKAAGGFIDKPLYERTI